MKFAALFVALSVSIGLAADARSGAQGSSRRGQRPAPLMTASPDKIADAYAQFLLGHRFEENEDETSAIAAYKRAMALDPIAAEIPAQLAGLTSQPTERRATWVKERLDSDDWVERRYQKPNGTAVTLFVARS